MDPASSLLVGHAAGKLLDKLGSSFRTHVIERWSRRRAEVFFEQFCDEVARHQGVSTADDDFAKDLTRMVEDDVCSEVLFDAYRRVSMSKSKLLGPRIFGLLTAQLVIEARTASDTEDTMFMVAESLTDAELVAFATFVREEQAKVKSDDVAGDLKIQWYQEELDDHRRRSESFATSPLDLDECLGGWAMKMKSFGVIADEVRERDFEYSPGLESPDMDSGTIREISWWIYVPAAFFRLVELVERAERVFDKTKSSPSPVTA